MVYSSLAVWKKLSSPASCLIIQATVGSSWGRIDLCALRSTAGAYELSATSPSATQQRSASLTNFVFLTISARQLWLVTIYLAAASLACAVSKSASSTALLCFAVFRGGFKLGGLGVAATSTATMLIEQAA
jgi:hypothetical protein